MNAPADRVRAVLSDPQQLQQAMPGVKDVQILSRTDDQARVAIETGLTLPGADRVEGDAFITPEGMRFTAAQPMPLALHLAAVPHGNGSEVTARIESELPPGLGMMARFIPQRVIEERVGAELDRALERLERVVQG
jgi:carbon monoxide dehydrogenase subunit G